MTEVTTTEKTDIAIPANDPWAKYEEQNPIIEGDLFLSFKSGGPLVGKYVYGPDNEELEIPTQLVINMSEFYRGFLKWGDSSNPGPDEEQIVRIESGAPMIQRKDLDERDETKWPKEFDKPQDPWKPCLQVQMKRESDGQQFKFTTATPCQINSFDRFFSDWIKQMRQHEGEHAIIELGKNKFEAASKNEIPFCTFKIVGWSSFEPVDDDAAALEQIKEQVEAPKSSKKKSNF